MKRRKKKHKIKLILLIILLSPAILITEISKSVEETYFSRYREGYQTGFLSGQKAGFIDGYRTGEERTIYLQGKRKEKK